MKEVNDYGQYRSVRRQGQDIQNMPVSNPLDLGFFRPTSKNAGTNISGNPLLLSEMKSFVDECVKYRGLIVLDFGYIYSTHSPLYTGGEITLYSDAVGLISYLDSLNVPFRNFKDVFEDDPAYTQDLTASNDFSLLSGTMAHGISVMDNDMVPAGTQAQINLITQPIHGNVIVSGDSLIYSPGTSCFQTDSFTYRLSNGILADTALVIVMRSKVEFSGQRTSWCTPSQFALKASIRGGEAPYTFLWSNGSTADSLLLSGGNSYTVTVTDKNGCNTVRAITLQNQNSPVPKVNNSVQCKPGIPSCNVIAEAGIVKWYADSSFNNLLQQGGSCFNGIIDSTKTLFVSVDYGGCSSSLVPVTVKVEKPSVSVSVESDTISCSSGTFRLRAITEMGLLYQWKKNGVDVANATNAKIVTANPGLYTVEVNRPEDNCTSVSREYNLIKTDSARIFADSAFAICNGDS
ncbi:MAG: Ig-like domain-containing protein, partial [Bacteroidota bacterium]